MSVSNTKASTGVFVAVEGVDGSGKTTLVKSLQASFTDLGISSVIFKNHIGLKSIFWESYSKSRKQLEKAGLSIAPDAARTLQTAEFLTFARNLLPQLLKTHRIVFADRYLVAKKVDSRVSLEGKIGSAEILLNAADDIRLPDLTIYLKTKPQTAWERIKAKKFKDWKESQEAISKAANYYDQILSSSPNTLILSSDFDSQITSNKAFKTVVEKFFHKLDVK